MRFYYLLLFSLVLSLSLPSCKVSEGIKNDGETEILPIMDTDTAVLVEEEVVDVKLYQAERTRFFKLIHTKLELSLDWEKQYLLGRATLQLEPYFYDQTKLQIDAKGFEIHSVSLLKGEQSEVLDYSYDGKLLYITLDTVYQKGQKVQVKIDYTAKPNEGDFANNPGSDQKGLYFINPKGEIIGKPRQLWTQGETDSNSRWFPTIDAPNQKSTQEVFLTVEDDLKTLSNGILVYSKSNDDSTRTDYWKMDYPHAPYLFMIAVGDFAIYEDNWNEIRVDYYMEQAYGKYAKDIFGNTPEMIEYFSETLKYPFPWPKYSQIVVRDFVSGAMENTTASVFMEELNVNSRELLDYNWDDIISHELFHHWFGDLVTNESWANLPLNESFATYGEYLWRNFKYGEDEGMYHLYDGLQTYLAESESKKEDLVRFYYDDSEEMFDAHSYEKGGLILHLLRNYVGDEAFFASLEYYLKAHAFGKAEVHELRLAFEHTTGEDLSWFFNQWFLSGGHPQLRVEEQYDSISNNYIVKVWQEQDLSLYPVFKLPMKLDLWEKGKKEAYTIEIDRPYQEFEFKGVKNPDLVLVDSEFALVGEMEHEKTDAQYQFQFLNYDKNVRARIEAIAYFLDKSGSEAAKLVLKTALNDPFWVIREDVLQLIESDTLDLFDKNEARIVSIAQDDPNPLAKSAAISVLESRSDPAYNEIFKSNLNDSSYSVAGQALYAYLQSDKEDVNEVAAQFSEETNFNITSTLADYYIQQSQFDQYSWFMDKLHIYHSEELWYFIKIFSIYLVSAPDDQIVSGLKELEQIAINHPQYYNRFAAYQGLEMFSDIEGVEETINLIKEKETDPRLRQYFD